MDKHSLKIVIKDKNSDPLAAHMAALKPKIITSNQISAVTDQNQQSHENPRIISADARKHIEYIKRLK